MDLKYIAENFSDKLCKGTGFTYKLNNSTEFKLVCKNTNLPHLLGLNKLIDFDVIVKLNDKTNYRVTSKNIYRDLVRENMTYDTISRSSYFDKIEERIKYFHHVENLVFEKVIIDFDKSKLKKTKIKADILLYKKVDNNELILCLVKNDKGNYSPETFLVHPNDYYTKGQTKIPIEKILVTGSRGEVVNEIVYIENEGLSEVAVSKIDNENN